MKTRCRSLPGHGKIEGADARPRLGFVPLLALGLGLAAFLAGCVRPFYHEKADEDVANPVSPGPHSPFADASNSQKETGTTDTSLPGGTPGRSPSGGMTGGSGTTESPDPLISTNGPRPFLLKLEQAVELGLINSREFQDRREDLYLQALPVTVERFAFASQFALTEELIRQRLGKFFPGGPSNSWVSNSNFGVTKLFSTGALLMLSLANRTVFEFGNPNVRHTVSQSTLDLDIIQPLLRGAGKAVTLEPLTLAERGLLYEVRDYARFRKQFYVNIAAGPDSGTISTGASRFRTRPLDFFSGLGLVGSAAVRPGRGVAPGVPASGAASVAGFLPTVLDAAQLEIERENVAKLEYFLRLFRAFEEGGVVSLLQVQQVESQLLPSRTAAFTRNQLLRDRLDRLKLQLGVPVDLPLQLDEEAVEPQTRQLRRFKNVITDFKTVLDEAELLGTVGEPGRTRQRLRELATRSVLVRDTRFRTEFPRRWASWERRNAGALPQRLNQYRDELRGLLASRDALERQGQAVPQTLAERIDEVRDEINLARFEQGLRLYEALAPARLAGTLASAAVPGGAGVLNPALILGARGVGIQRGSQVSAFRDVLNSFGLVMIRARDERVALTHRLWPMLPRLCVNGVDLLAADLDRAEAAVVQAALSNRFDLQNTRAQLVDAWRQIRVAANSLLGTFNVEYHLTSETPAGLAMPLAFAGSRTRHQLILNTELPLVRVLERNAYRASLIGWERWRRTVMAAEDNVATDVRSDLRDLRVLAANYKIQQEAVEVAYLQVENAEDIFLAPPEPTALQGPPSPGTAAALTQQLLGAQATLRAAQLTLLSVWTDYLISRMQLYRDLELMPLDPRGVWIDDVSTCQCPSDDSHPKPVP